jgi:hypothetical protein
VSSCIPQKKHKIKYNAFKIHREKVAERYFDGFFIAQNMKKLPEDWNEQRRLSGFPER